MADSTDDYRALLKSFLEAALRPSAPVFIIGGLIILLFPLLLHYILHRATPYTSLPSILLVGPAGAGKTSFLTLLERGPLSKGNDNGEKADGQKTTGEAVAARTHTSQAASAIELHISEDGASKYTDDLDATGASAKKFLLIDTPGHGKLRGAAMARLDFSKDGKLSSSSAAKALIAPSTSIQNADNARLKGVIFMLDAAALGETDDALPAAAEYLYDVLLALQKRTGAGKSSRAPASVPVLVAANKSDLFTALPAALVKSQLEAELGRIRRSRSKGLLDSGVGTDEADAREEGDEWLGEYGSDKFAFGQMREFDVEVDVLGGNTVGELSGVDKWWEWIGRQI